MRAPVWKQHILLVTNDSEVKQRVTAAFGAETFCVIAKDAVEAISQIKQIPFQVFIVDEKALINTQGNTVVSIVELTQKAHQSNQGLNVIVLANGLPSLTGDFARSCGAILIMDRKYFSVERMIFIIRIMRKRTFRTILLDDLRDNKLEVDIYHYLPLSDRYAVAFPKNEPISIARKEKLDELKIYHLFVLENDFPNFIHALQGKVDSDVKHKPILSYQLSLIRDQFKETLIQLFDGSTDGIIHAEKVLYDQMFDLVKKLETLVFSFEDFHQCLEKLPYPRWSMLAHGINSAIYTMVFARICKLENIHEITLAALYHNIGIADIAQSLTDISESKMPNEEKNSYALHVNASIEILKQKIGILPKITELAILQHHENYNGTGYPQKLSGEAISLGARLLSIVGSFDYFASVKPKEQKRSLREAWFEFMKSLDPEYPSQSKFDPNLVDKLDDYFQTSLI